MNLGADERFRSRFVAAGDMIAVLFSAVIRGILRKNGKEETAEEGERDGTAAEQREYRDGEKPGIPQLCGELSRRL